MSTASPNYAFSLRTLRRWRDERLRLREGADGSVVAEFFFDGSTCGNIPLKLRYRVRLAPAGEKLRLCELACEPAPGDDGHTHMCSYLDDARHILGLLRTEQPLLGEPLDAVIAWRPATSPAGCTCAASSRAHKWLAVLQTTHFALAGRVARQPVQLS